LQGLYYWNQGRSATCGGDGEHHDVQSFKSSETWARSWGRCIC